jgi:hypothetical protein
MTEIEVNLPPGKPWPPPDDAQAALALVKEITAAAAGKQGKHWALQVYVENPISGYKVKFKPTGPDE